MLNINSNKHLEKVISDNRFRSRNWEEDIDDVTLEECDFNEDPTGFKVRFHRQGMKAKFEDSFDTFHIGASFLNKRYQRILEAGYIAPMTEKAISLLEGRSKLCDHASA
tara:strand:- start:37 stop:363 length:327 start_codon:yes stop_codon:yes gene_type:complete